MKYLVDERVEKGYPDEPLLTASQSRGVIPKADYGSRTVEAQKDLHLLKLVEPGDYVISLRSFQGGIEFAHVRGIISPAYTVLKPNTSVRRGYYKHFFKSADFINSMTLFVTGIREGQNIDYVRLSRAFLPVPPPEEQDAIGRFIRHLDQRVNRLVKAKRRLIELLNEQKQAIIHRAVTQGLDPNILLKPSGIAWLGSVPAHWIFFRLKDVAAVQAGLTLGKTYLNQSTRTYPYIRVANVQAGRLSLKSVKTIDVPEDEAASCTLRPGDVLMTEGGDIDKLGRGCLWNGEINCCLHQNHIFAVRCSQEIVPKFLEALMASPQGRRYFEQTAKQTTNLASTNRTTVKAFPFYLPPRDEQEQILDALFDSTSELENALGMASSEIDLIREYRTRLVADVVTGQLDVRHLDLPEVEDSLIESIESAEQEPEDELADEMEEES